MSDDERDGKNSNRPAAIGGKIGDRVAKINTQLRMLWTQYDPDLNTRVDTVPLCHKYISHAFNDAGFRGDFEKMENENEVGYVENLIDEIYREGNKAPGPQGLNTTRAGQSSPPEIVSLSQN